MTAHPSITSRGDVLRAVGLISGTSMDGVDAAAIEVELGEPLRVTTHAFLTQPYPAPVRDELRALCHGAEGSAHAVCRMHMVVGEIFAQAAQAVLHNAGWSSDQVAVVGSHGQTTVSDMTDGSLAGFRTYSTLQLGSPAVIAERTGMTVISDFRARDIAAGGRGAPLAPMLDAILYMQPGLSRALLNLGGIANITLLPASGRLDEVMGFDIGPANMPLDAVMRLTSGGTETYDHNGDYAARGRVDPTLLDHLLAHPFVQQEPPKATGSEEFGDEFVAALLAEYTELPRNDVLATLVRFAATSVRDALRRWSPEGRMPTEVLVSGGGVHNRAFMDALADGLGPVPVRPVAEGGNALTDVHVDAKEAVLFALLAILTVQGQPGNVPSATGATHPVVLGSITPGRRTYDLARLWQING